VASFKSFVAPFETLQTVSRFTCEKLHAIKGIRINPSRSLPSLRARHTPTQRAECIRAAAKKALEFVDKTPEDCGSYEELLALLRQNLAQQKLPKALRIAPFMSFLDSKIPKNPEDIPDYGPIRSRVVDRIEDETRGTRKALHFIPRDLAMLACLCVAPEKGSPRRCPKGALAVTRKGGGI
jgi:hypothetical protein